MEAYSFGWEADQIDDKSVTVSYPFVEAITLRGYQIDVAFMPWQEGSVFQGGGWSEVLLHIYVTPGVISNPNSVGTPVYTDADPKGHQNLHGNADTAHICRAILKGYVGGATDCVNKSLILMGLDIPVSAGSSIVMVAGHAGYGPIDFETQGVLFFDDK